MGSGFFQGLHNIVDSDRLPVLVKRELVKPALFINNIIGINHTCLFQLILKGVFLYSICRCHFQGRHLFLVLFDLLLKFLII